MKPTLLLFLLGLALSKPVAASDLYIGTNFFGGIFEVTETGADLEIINDFDPRKVMTSTFKADGTLKCLTILEDLSRYATTHQNSLQKAVASCIHAETACGFSTKYPTLAGWEAHSIHCNPDYCSAGASAAWLATLRDEESNIASQLENFMKTVIDYNFKAATYTFKFKASKKRSSSPAATKRTRTRSKAPKKRR